MSDYRCISLKVEISEKIEVVHVKNTGATQNRCRPEAFAQNPSGNTDHI